MPSPRSSPVALRVELLEIEPIIWRRIVVSNQWTFASLHNYLQWVMGWQDTHAHEFRVGDRWIAPDWWIQEAGLDREVRSYTDERRISIAAVVREIGIGGEFEYHYDMGDGWVHRIVIETMPEFRVDDLRTPLCMAGENACPPEDVGGPFSYPHFLECIANRAHPEHSDMLQWIGGVFDPKGFDLNRLNRDWRPGRRGAR
jgi:Plasmid pRiA4b ORF-3-like protein